MTALVTGATGFLGGALVERLLARGAGELRCLVRPGSRRGALDAVRARYPAARVEYVTGTLTSAEDAARALAGADVVYHLAASLAGAAADIFLHTVVATKRLLDAVVAAGRPIKIVLVSSFGVYGVAELPRGALVDESTPLEPHPERRDLYSQAKLRQEKLCWEYQRDHGLALAVLRPGVIFGPRGGAFSARVGLDLFGVFLALGGRNPLPLTYVDNCAEAIAVAGASPHAVGQVYNVVDDDLPTCRAYLRRFRAEVRPLRALPVPYPAMLALSKAVESYHRWSRGQLPAVFTPYKTRTTWGGNRFANDKLKGLGWRPLVSTEEGLARTFAALRERGHET